MILHMKKITPEKEKLSKPLRLRNFKYHNTKSIFFPFLQQEEPTNDRSPPFFNPRPGYKGRIHPDFLTWKIVFSSSNLNYVFKYEAIFLCFMFCWQNYLLVVLADFL